jgi:hypothetical protein
LTNGNRHRIGGDQTNRYGGPVKPKLTEPESTIWDELIGQIDPAILRACCVHELRMPVDELANIERLRKAINR